MSDSVRDLKAQLQSERADKEMWKKKYEDLAVAHAQLQTSHNEVIQKTGYKQPRVYEYGEHECRPLHLGEVCEIVREDGTVCGYDYRKEIDGVPNQRFMMRPSDKRKESHPIV